MALNTKVGTFSASGTTGNQSITGVGFQPKLLLFFVVPKTGDGSNPGCSMAVGAAASATKRAAAFFNSNDAAGVSVVSIAQRNDACIQRASNTSVIYRADLVSMDADGFTLNTVTADGSARTVVYMAIGGSDVVDVSVGTFQAPAATGSQDISESFEPDSVLFFGCSLQAVMPQARNNENAHFCLGFANSSSDRGYACIYDEHGADVSVCKRRQKQDGAFEIINGTTSLAKFDYTGKKTGGGFTINWSAVSASPQPYVGYVAIKGPKFKIKTFTQPGSTGNQATTGVGFLPRALLMVSACNVASSTIDASARLAIGAAVSSSQREALWTGETDAKGTTETNCYLDSTKAIKLLTETATNPTLNAQADLVSLDADGFTLNWDTVDATAREIMALAIGDAAVAAPGSATFAVGSEALGIGAGKTWAGQTEGLVPSTGVAGTTTVITRRIRKIRKVR